MVNGNLDSGNYLQSQLLESLRQEDRQSPVVRGQTRQQRETPCQKRKRERERGGKKEGVKEEKKGRKVGGREGRKEEKNHTAS